MNKISLDSNQGRSLNPDSDRPQKRQKTDDKENKDNKEDRENKENKENLNSSLSSLQFGQSSQISQQSQSSNFNSFGSAGVMFEGSLFMDFSNFSSREKYHPDTKLISEIDGTVLYYHIYQLVDIKFFGDKYTGNGPESKSKEIKLNYDGRIINYFLNYMENSDKFAEYLRMELSGKKNEYIVNRYGCAVDLMRLAEYINYERFRTVCRKYLSTCGLINETINMWVINHTEELPKKQLWTNVIEGKSIIKNLSSAAISNIYDFAMDNKMFYGAMQNIVPHFIPSDDQVNRFNIMTETVTIPDTESKAFLFAENSSKPQLNKVVIRAFVGKYYGGNNAGANKIILKLLSDLIFMY